MNTVEKRETTKRDVMILRNSVKDPKKTSRDVNRDFLAAESVSMLRLLGSETSARKGKDSKKANKETAVER